MAVASPRFIRRARIAAVILGGLLCSIGAALGATLTKGSISGQVQQFTDSGAVTGCGLTVTALETPTSRNGKLAIFNGSFSVMGPVGGLVKGRFAEIETAVLLTGRSTAKDVRPLITEGIWMKAPGHDATTPAQGSAPTKSDDPGYIIYVSGLEPILGLVNAVQEKKPIQVGGRVKGRTTDQALYGVVEISESDLEQLNLCISEWSADALKKLRSKLVENADGPAKPD